MPDENQTEKPAGQAPAGDNAALLKQIEDLKNENKSLAATAKTAADKADRASNVLQRMLAQLEQTAQQRGNGRGDEREDRGNDAERFKEMFDENPAAALDAYFNTRMGSVLQQQNENMAAPNRDGARERAKAMGWSKYDEEVDKFMENMPADVKAKPGSWDAAYRYVVSGHITEVVDETLKLEREKASRPEGASGGSDTRPKAPTMDAMEKDIMKAMGVEESDWMKYRDTQFDVPKEKPNTEGKAA